MTALQRCVTELVPVAALAPPARDALAGRRVAVLGGDGARRAALARAVADHGGRPVEVDRDADGPAVAELVAGADTLVDLNLVHTDAVGPGDWRRPLAQTYAALGAVAGGWVRERRTGRHAYVAVTALGGRLGADPAAVRQPLSGLWAGLAKTVPRELPTCDVRVVDLDGDADPGVAVVAELAGGRFLEVAWSQGRRHVLLPRPLPAAERDDGAPIDPSALVLLTGGGRGIGYHLARRMRGRHGCRVVVTGRLDLDDEPADLLAASDEEFSRVTADLLRSGRGPGGLRAARHEVQRLARARELWGNLTDARRAGADLEYRRCDVTDPAQVADLLAGLPGPLAAVVHDAGVDRPARLGRKSAAEAQAVVSVKVDGFLHLLAALEGRPAGVLCAVGSLTGRYGGTAGQTDYAGANEALARLAGWASARRPEPVTCLSWPTWQAVGLISDSRAAVREMSAVPVAAGVRAWEGELRCPRPGEVLYLAELGALAPPQVRGIPVPSDQPAGHVLVRRRHLLGDVEAFAPGELLETRHRVDADGVPAVHGFLVAGRPSLPVSLLLELLLDAARWLGRGPARPAAVAAVRGLRVGLGALRLPAAGPLVLARRARTRADGDDWCVDVEVVRDGPGPGDVLPVATATVVCRPPAAVQPAGAGPGAGPGPGPGLADAELPDPGAPGVAWSPSPGLMAATGRGAERRVWAEPRTGGDLYALVHPPEPMLPAGVLEGLLWAGCPPEAGAGWALHVGELVRGDGDPGRCVEGRVDTATGAALATDPAGCTVLGLTGLRWQRGEVR